MIHRINSKNVNQKNDDLNEIKINSTKSSKKNMNVNVIFDNHFKSKLSTTHIFVALLMMLNNICGDVRLIALML